MNYPGIHGDVVLLELRDLRGITVSQKYQLKELLRAVHLSGDQIGGIREIPSGALITVLGDAMVPGLTEVEYQGEHYALFHEDLVCRAMKVWAASGGR